MLIIQELIQPLDLKQQQVGQLGLIVIELELRLEPMPLLMLRPVPSILELILQQQLRGLKPTVKVQRRQLMLGRHQLVIVPRLMLKLQLAPEPFTLELNQQELDQKPFEQQPNHLELHRLTKQQD